MSRSTDFSLLLRYLHTLTLPLHSTGMGYLQNYIQLKILGLDGENSFSVQAVLHSPKIVFKVFRLCDVTRCVSECRHKLSVIF